MTSIVRLFVEHDLRDGGSVVLADQQTHYLRNVMRLPVGGKVSLFNGDDGEWEAEIALLDKRKTELRVVRRTREQAS
ncbi:MAG: 16S rRNA (uracil(1498)-N(3))-methyltransferase, partial [Proteobacteria bacterium]|nr:16S rRNA (uracil(1498)-N(3))-methyltransferase [Pseudomonadota bacterium]